MIFTRDGQPMDAGFWLDFKLALTARLKERAARGRYHYLMNADGTRYYRVGKTKLGDPLRIFRDVSYFQPARYNMQAIRATHGVGRPVAA